MAIALANPIYDSVFKFLMEDIDIAREITSAIIGQDILQIEVKPQENIIPIKNSIGFFTVYRLDFLATIQETDGTKRKILIELQKAKFSSDIMRFRKYLGEQYKKDALPIITIYFLGYNFDESLPSVIKVERQYKDRLTNGSLEKKNEFIESLTHDSFIIQVLKLKMKVRNKLERVLSIFEQTRLSEDKHIVYYEYPIEDELQKKITRRLNYAVSDEQVKKEMDIEEEILDAFQESERKIGILSEEKDKALEEKDKALEEKDKALEEKDKALEEIKEKDRLIQELMNKLKQNKL